MVEVSGESSLSSILSELHTKMLTPLLAKGKASVVAMMLNEVKQSIELRGRTRKENSVACIFQIPQVGSSRNFLYRF